MSFSEHLDIIYEDNHCLGLNKPAGWPTTHFQGTEETVDRLAKSYLKEKYRKAGNVFLGVVHRLDKPVSGALLFARTSKAAARLSEQFRLGVVEKVYWAVVEVPNGQRNAEAIARLWLQQDTGVLDDWLIKDDSRQCITVVSRHTPGALLARVVYQVKARHGGLVWLELRPHTGRKHQLRVQLAHRGCPVYGDTKYGSLYRFGHAIALHARSLTFLHPVSQAPITLTADLPRYWYGRFAYLLKGRF
ncbi:MAG: RluA family pseudouridine synthase [Thermogemmata sp.]|nr:RluA family pseudouridine synthase [Thermogemmata sp.]